MYSGLASGNPRWIGDKRMRYGEAKPPLWTDVLELLRKLLVYDLDVQQNARQQLYRLDREPTIRVLSAVLADENPEDPELRYRAAGLLARLDPKRAATLLIPCLKSRDPLMRSEACGLLSTMRSEACGLLSTCDDQEATVPLMDVMRNDPKASTRMLAAFALGKVGDRRAITALQWVEQHDSGTDWEGRHVSDAATDAIREILARHPRTNDSQEV
jgi:HEAT repeat protein